MKKPEESDAVYEVNHRHVNSVASLQCARVNKSITYILHCINKTHPFTSYHAAKHQKSANLGLQTYEKNRRSV